MTMNKDNINHANKMGNVQPWWWSGSSGRRDSCFEKTTLRCSCIVKVSDRMKPKMQNVPQTRAAVSKQHDSWWSGGWYHFRMECETRSTVGGLGTHRRAETKPMDALNKCVVHKNYIYSYSLTGPLSAFYDAIDSVRVSEQETDCVMHTRALGVVFVHCKCVSMWMTIKNY